MLKQIPRLVLILLAVSGALLFVSCSDDDDNGDVNPATVEALLIQKVDNVPGLAEALQRTLAHLSGTQQEGVNIVPSPTGGTGTVEVDLDDDGFRESTVTGSFTLNNPAVGIAAGATIEITELTGNVVDMTASLGVTGPTQATFGNIVANVPAEGSRPQVTVSSGAINVDVSTSPPALDGFAEFAVGNLPATMYLTDDGSGGLFIDVIGDGFQFTVP